MYATYEAAWWICVNNVDTKSLTFIFDNQAAS